MPRPPDQPRGPAALPAETGARKRSDPGRRQEARAAAAWRLWLEERTGWPSALRAFAGSHVPGGARWVRSFGAAALLLLAAQLASGFALGLDFNAGPGAWESAAQLDAQPLGHLLRSLHARGADLLVLALLLHLLQTALAGAFRAPREVGWWLGALSLALVFAAALSGLLLPWDERAHALLQLAGALPFSSAAARLLGESAPAAGRFLTRAWALHALGIPAALALLLHLHTRVARRHGPVAPRALPPTALDVRHPYWPGQARADALVSLAALLGLAALSVARPALLLAPADPAALAGAPALAWYLRPLAELLRLLPPRLAPLAAWAPLGAALLLLALPVSGRGDPRRPAARLPGWAVAAMLAIATSLGASSALRELRTPALRREQALAEDRARLALRLAAGGMGAEAVLARIEDAPAARGARLFGRRCLACHRVGERGAEFGPALTDYLSRAWLRGVIRDAGAPAYYGQSRLHGMEPQDLDAESLDLLAELLHQLRELPPGGPPTPALEGARRLFESARCARCHALEPGQTSLGPALAGYGSAAWLDGLLRDPASPSYFGAQNQMVVSGEPLTDSQRGDLVAYLQSLETR